MDAKSAERLSKVHPELSKRVVSLIAEFERHGIDVRVVQGLRTYSEQDALYNQPHDHKDNDGDHRIDEADEMVTRARGGYSNHNFGLAVDLCLFKNGKPQWNDISVFDAIGALGKARGLKWGGDWKFTDRPHLELPGPELAECRILFARGGLVAVWNKASGGMAPPASALRVMQRGDSGQDVKALQAALKVSIDSEFGPGTETAVKAFQRAHNLIDDGKVGPQTRKALGI
jgi:peptidoglycan L-alanyl-D-glutamate endopeptidase CwlK